MLGRWQPWHDGHQALFKRCILKTLAKLNWPHPKEDFQLLEKEILEGRKTLDYLCVLLAKNADTQDSSDDNSMSDSMSVS